MLELSLMRMFYTQSSFISSSHLLDVELFCGNQYGQASA